MDRTDRFRLDVAEAGGLMSMMRAESERIGVDLGELSTQYGAAGEMVGPVTVRSDRGKIHVRLGGEQEGFRFDIQATSFFWGSGCANDIHGLVEMLAAWRRGMPAKDFAVEFPFVALGHLAEAHESGDPVSAQWEWILSVEEFEEERPLLEAAHANERVRSLFPNLSHGVLRLSRDLGVQGGREIHITQYSENVYRVKTDEGAAVVDVNSPAEAVAIAAEAMNDWFD